MSMKPFQSSQDFLEKNHISTKSAMGKQVAFEVYISYAQYLSESELPTNNKKKVAIDGNIYVQTILTIGQSKVTLFSWMMLA